MSSPESNPEPRPGVSAGTQRALRLVSLLICLAVGFGARTWAVEQFSGVDGLQGDERYFVQAATSIHAGEGHPGSVRPPLYPWVIAQVFDRAGEGDLDAVRNLQLWLGLLTVLLVHQVCAARLGTLAAFLAGLCCALSPGLVHYTHFLWSEALMAVLAMLVFWALDAFDRTGRVWLLVPAGLLLGLCALTRETWVHFSVLAALWVAWPRPGGAEDEAAKRTPAWRGGLGRAALLLVAVATVVLPWTHRNSGVQDQFVLISTNRWFPIASGNLPLGDQWLLGKSELKPYRKQLKKGTELEEEAYWKELAVEWIASEQPTWIFKKIPRTFCRLLGPRSQPVRFIEEGWLPNPGDSAPTIVNYNVIGNGLLAILGLVGLCLVRPGRISLLLAASVGFTFAVHTLANAVPRFLVPLYPILAIYAGGLLAGRIRPDGRRWRWPLALALAGMAIWAIAIQW